MGIAFHRACEVINSHRVKLNIYKIVDGKNSKNAPKIQEEGIYFFGGKTQGDETIGILRILRIGNSFSWYFLIPGIQIDELPS